MALPRSALAALAALSIASAARVQPCSWVRYTQYDPAWGSVKLAGGSSTLSSKGCAVTSVAMALASRGFRIGSATPNPANLNQWLIQNGGFVGNAIVWGSVGKLGMNNVLYGSPSLEQMRSYVRSCNPMVINVRNGGHWVLVTGYDDTNSNFYVNDPGYADTFYPFSAISRVAVYTSNRAMLFGAQEPAMFADFELAAQPALEWQRRPSRNAWPAPAPLPTEPRFEDFPVAYSTPQIASPLHACLQQCLVGGGRSAAGACLQQCAQQPEAADALAAQPLALSAAIIPKCRDDQVYSIFKGRCVNKWY